MRRIRGQIYQIPAPPGFNTPMYIETNPALGGYWGGDVNRTTPFPSKMQVDYIRVYSSKQDSLRGRPRA